MAHCDRVRSSPIRIVICAARPLFSSSETDFFAFEEPLQWVRQWDGAHSLEPALQDLYLSTLRDTLTGLSLKTPSIAMSPPYATLPFKDVERQRGWPWCIFCYTLLGTERLNVLWQLVKRTIEDGVLGDFVETGAWRGGASMFARAVQRVYGKRTQRRVYVCDSFSGLPLPSNPVDSSHWEGMDYLDVPLDEVRDNFERFQMLDSGVVFVRGFFQVSMPALRDRLKQEGRRISVLHVDADMFESYLDVFYNLYELVAIGGFVVCDDCSLVNKNQGYLIPEASYAVMKFWAQSHLRETPFEVVDSPLGTFWRKTQPGDVNYTWYLLWNWTRRKKKP